MRKLTSILCLTIAVLLGSAGCRLSPENGINAAIKVTMAEHRKTLATAIRNDTPYITVTCPEPYGVSPYFPEQFDWFFERYGDRPLIKDAIFNVKCSVLSWNKVLSPTERKNLESNRVSAHINQSKATCAKLGFNPNTDKFADCALRLMEMQSNKSPQTVIQNNSGDSSAVRALLEKQKKQRQLEGSLELMKRGLEIMSPPKPRITCRYSAISKTTVCN